MCLCIWRNDLIVYAFERILSGANVAKASLSNDDRVSFDKYRAQVKWVSVASMIDDWIDDWIDD